jgi:hypothetical protein
MLADLPPERKLRRAWFEAPGEVGRDAPGDNQSRAAFRPRLPPSA